MLQEKILYKLCLEYTRICHSNHGKSGEHAKSNIFYDRNY